MTDTEMTQSPRRTRSLLEHRDPNPVGIRNGECASTFLMTCEHAGNAVPKALNGLGLGADSLNEHIAVDIGALGVAEVVSDAIKAPLVFQRYSRLVAESNRRLDSDQLIARTSDGIVIPGNQAVSADERAQRVDEIVAPYHAEIARRLDQRRDQGIRTIVVSMHSFTPSLKTAPTARPWHVGICVGVDERFTRHVEAVLRREKDIVVGFNEPYSVDMADEYAIPVHAEARNLPYVQFEIRNDLIRSASGQLEWGKRIAAALQEAQATFFA